MLLEQTRAECEYILDSPHSKQKLDFGDLPCEPVHVKGLILEYR